MSELPYLKRKRGDWSRSGYVLLFLPLLLPSPSPSYPSLFLHPTSLPLIVLSPLYLPHNSLSLVSPSYSFSHSPLLRSGLTDIHSSDLKKQHRNYARLYKIISLLNPIPSHQPQPPHQDQHRHRRLSRLSDRSRVIVVYQSSQTRIRIVRVVDEERQGGESRV